MVHTCRSLSRHIALRAKQNVYNACVGSKRRVEERDKEKKQNESMKASKNKNTTDWDTEPSEKYLWWVTIVIFGSSSLLQKCEKLFFFYFALDFVLLFSLSWYWFLFLSLACLALSLSFGWFIALFVRYRIPYSLPPVVCYYSARFSMVNGGSEWVHL